MINTFRWLWQRLLRFFSFGKRGISLLGDKLQETAPAKVIKSRHERWVERHPAGKSVSTKRGGLNMPKYQPCPLCRHRSKRLEKTLGGAHYHCPNPDHSNFLVRA